MRRALLVDPNVARLDLLKKEINQAVAVTACTDFVDARTYLLTEAPDFLITHVRLGAYNGLHLVHLLGPNAETRSLLYEEPIDIHLAFEAQLLGAFYESTSRLRFALRAYLARPLPERDRRNARSVDRRGLFRGGRRSTDRGPAQIPGASGWLH